MEAVVKGHNLAGAAGLGIVGVHTGIDLRPLAGKFHGALIGLSTGVAVEDTVREATLHQALGQRSLRLGVEQVAGMHQLGGLLLDSLHPVRVAMSDGIHRNAGSEVQELAAVGGEQLHALAVGEHQVVRAPVRLQHVLVLVGHHLCGLIGLLQHGAGGAAALAARCWASRGGQAASAAGRSAAAGSGVSAAREGNGGRESGHGEDGLRS
mmetsp:Transcript_44748/g.114412  ORF Transcript_44748/g.114412 Transcript_44748/m.114412 type:complete len:209 (+) Transcript_44748:1264-1890(+)